MKKKIDENKKHKEEGEAILRNLEKGFADISEEKDIVLSDDKLSKIGK